MPTIAVLGTFDTKGPEHAFIADFIRQSGHEPLLIDVGSHQAPALRPDISSAEVAAATGENWQDIFARQDRGECVALMSRAAAAKVSQLAAANAIQGIISLGGGGGTAIATAAMRALPVGFPKLMVSTLAGGQVAPYVGASDIVMMPAIVDVSGINRISRPIFENAAAAVCGMAGAWLNRLHVRNPEKPIIAASMFGNTTDCVNAARQLLEAAGYEVLVFHATGVGGKTMENLIASGMIDGVLDITTTEWADELVGGILSAGPERLNAAADHHIPAILVPGCLDMVNFGEPHTVPAKFSGRTFYHHNPQVTLMRTSPAEAATLGRILAEKANRHEGAITVLLPKKGISIISAASQPFYDPASDEALFSAIKTHLRPEVPLIEADLEINDPAFAQLCAEALLAHLKVKHG